MIEVTDAAAKRIREAMATEGVVGSGLRVGVKAGGCSGFSYVFKWEQAPTPDDQVFKSENGAVASQNPRSVAKSGLCRE